MTKFGTILLNQIRAMSARVGQGFLPKKEIKDKAKDGSRIKKPAYKPGNAGLSKVSAAIQKEYGSIVCRRERKEIAREAQTRRIRYYNGPAGQPQYNRNIGRSKYNGKGQLI